jgi:large repetitive protein
MLRSNCVRKLLRLAVVLCSTAASLVAQQTTGVSGAFNTGTPMNAARDGASVAVLTDGRMLITGGTDANGIPIASTEFLGNGTSAGSLSTPRSHHASVTLKDGRVLVAGGVTIGGVVTNTTEIFDPTAGTWIEVAQMQEARADATATLLTDGRVLIAGGKSGVATLQTMEIFDPVAGLFTSAAPMSSMRQKHAAALMPDGRVVIAGGSDGTNPLSSIDIYDPASNSVTPFALPMSIARAGLSATTLWKGQVLLAGGGVASTDILDPVAGNITPGPTMNAARTAQLALPLPNNNTVLIVSGTSDSAAAEIYVPWQNAFSPFGTLAKRRHGFERS